MRTFSASASFHKHQLITSFSRSAAAHWPPGTPEWTPKFQHTCRQCRLIMKRFAECSPVISQSPLFSRLLPKIYCTSLSSPPLCFSTGAPLSPDNPVKCGSGHVPAFPFLPARENCEEGEEEAECLFYHQTRFLAGNLLFISRR